MPNAKNKQEVEVVSKIIEEGQIYATRCPTKHDSGWIV